MDNILAWIYIVVGLGAAAVWLIGEGVLFLMDLRRRRTDGARGEVRTGSHDR
jgi:hypothetical protein